MNRFFSIFALFFVASAAFAQTAGRSSSSSVSRVIWEPPTWNFLDGVVPKATVPKEMLATLRVSDLPITLEDTKMEDVRTILGGTFGGRGDAGESDQWLCLNGADSSGRWVLWLESGEIDGGTVGSFQWQRLDQGAKLDRRCRLLGDAKVVLPIALRLATGEAEVLKTLGQPTVRQGDRLIYVHEHQESIRGEPFTSFNIVSILLRAERAWAIEVSKTTTN
jgi:hypothetical protein